MCNFCGQVCPTEAIRQITMEEKRLIQLGVAHIDKTRCIAWDTEKICLVCNEQCSYQAIIGDDKKRPIVKKRSARGAASVKTSALSTARRPSSFMPPVSRRN